MIEEGEDFVAGAKITDGSINPKQQLKGTDVETTQQYI